MELDGIAKKVLEQNRGDLVNSLRLENGSLLLAKLQQDLYVNQNDKENIYGRKTEAGSVGELMNIMSRGLTRNRFAALVVAIGDEEVVNNRGLKETLIKCYKDKGGVWTQEMKEIFQQGDDSFIDEVKKMPKAKENDALRRILNRMRFQLMTSIDINAEESFYVINMQAYFSPNDVDEIYRHRTRRARVECFIDTLIRVIKPDCFSAFVDAIADPTIGNNQVLGEELKRLANNCGFAYDLNSPAIRCEAESTRQLGPSTSVSDRFHAGGKSVSVDETDSQAPVTTAPSTSTVCSTIAPAAASLVSLTTKYPLRFLSQHPSGDLVFYEQQNKSILQFDLGDKKFREVIELPGDLEDINSSRFLGDSTFMVRCGSRVHFLKKNDRLVRNRQFHDMSRISYDVDTFKSKRECWLDCCNDEPMSCLTEDNAAQKSEEEVGTEDNASQESEDEVTFDALICFDLSDLKDLYVLMIGFQDGSVKCYTIDPKSEKKIEREYPVVIRNEFSSSSEAGIREVCWQRGAKGSSVPSVLWSAEKSIDFGEINNNGFEMRGLIPVTGEVIGCTFKSTRPVCLAVCFIDGDGKLKLKILEYKDNEKYEEMRCLDVGSEIRSPVDLYWKDKKELLIALNTHYAEVTYPCDEKAKLIVKKVPLQTSGGKHGAPKFVEEDDHRAILYTFRDRLSFYPLPQ